MEENLLKLLRKKTGLSQGQVASYLDVDQTLISKVEINKRNLKDEYKDKLHLLYGDSLDNCLSFSGSPDLLDTRDLNDIAYINKMFLDKDKHNG